MLTRHLGSFAQQVMSLVCCQLKPEYMPTRSPRVIQPSSGIPITSVVTIRYLSAESMVLRLHVKSELYFAYAHEIECVNHGSRIIHTLGHLLALSLDAADGASAVADVHKAIPLRVDLAPKPLRHCCRSQRRYHFKHFHTPCIFPEPWASLHTHDSGSPTLRARVGRPT